LYKLHGAAHSNSINMSEAAHCKICKGIANQTLQLYRAWGAYVTVMFPAITPLLLLLFHPHPLLTTLDLDIFGYTVTAHPAAWLAEVFR
jgi:hypothetical protein